MSMTNKIVLKKVLNVSGRFVDYFLHGERGLRPRRAKALADYLDVPVTYILFPEDYGIDLHAFLSKAIARKRETMEQESASMSADGARKEDSAQ